MIGVVALLAIVAYTSYHLSSGGATSVAGRTPAVGTSAPPNNIAAVMEGARIEAQTFLRQIGAGDASACSSVHGVHNILAPASSAPIGLRRSDGARVDASVAGRADCAATAQVLQAVGIASGELDGENDGYGPQADQQAFVSIAYVPALAASLNRLELTLDYHDTQWFVIQLVMQ